MDGQLYIPIFYEGREMYLEGNIQSDSVLPGVEVDVFTVRVLFVYDPASNGWAAIAPNDKSHNLDKNLLEVIATSLHSLLKM